MALGNGIAAEGLVRDYGKGVRAVDGIDLDVAAGEIFGFLGPNGAGKSTTVLMLTTLLPPTGGRAVVGGFDLVREAASVRSAIGAALQQAALDPHLTAREHMRFQAALHGLPKARRVARGEELLDRIGLSEVADRKVGGYSGGMKRRLDLALALVHQPRVLFLDEPTTGLDVRSRTALWDEVSRLAREEGVTVFLTTQYLEEADVLADRVAIVVLHRFGPPAAASPEGVAVRVRDASAKLPAIVRAVDDAGIAVADLRVHPGSLDDVFLARTGRSIHGAAIPSGLDAAPARRLAAA
jgi:ABC-2 type transport system ATP-binding protein